VLQSETEQRRENTEQIVPTPLIFCDGLRRPFEVKKRTCKSVVKMEIKTEELVSIAIILAVLLIALIAVIKTWVLR